MRTPSVARRLGSVFAVVALTFTAALAVAVTGIERERSIDRTLQTIEAVQGQLRAVHYYDADVCGWESFILLTAYDQGAGAALDPGNDNVIGLRDSRAGLGRALALVDLGSLTPAERSVVQELRQVWARYWTADEAFLALVRRGTPQALKAAGQQLNAGPSADLYEQLIDVNARLADSVAKRLTVAHVAADAAARATVLQAVGAGVLALAAGIALLTWATRGITGPLRSCRDVLHDLAGKDLTVRVPDVRGRGEVADIAAAVTRMRDMMRSQLGSIQDVAEDLDRQSGVLTASGRTAGEAAAGVAAGTSGAAGRAVETSAAVEGVAAAGQEMDAGIKDIARSTQDGVAVVADAVHLVAAGEAAVGGLTEAAERIGTVVGFITSITEQTHLLALNATIEAARAGKAGEGFAVVADEVKKLAQETARATGQIIERVTSFQQGTASAAAALASVEQVIERVNDLQATVAGTVEQQAAASDALSRDIQTAADGVAGMATSLTEIAGDAGASAQASRAVQEAADVLAADSHRLTEIVSGFRTA